MSLVLDKALYLSPHACKTKNSGHRKSSAQQPSVMRGVNDSSSLGASASKSGQLRCGYVLALSLRSSFIYLIQKISIDMRVVHFEDEAFAHELIMHPDLFGRANLVRYSF